MTDQSQVIEEELLVDQPEPELSLRDTIIKARDEAVEKQTSEAEKPIPKPKQIKSGRERDETGKFAAKSEEISKEQPVIAARTAQEPVKPADINQSSSNTLAAPQGFSGAVKARWAELPPDVQQELHKRDADFHRELTKHDEERNFGRQVDKVVQPYMAQIRAEGSDAPTAIASLLNMAHVLRVGSLQQKSDLLWRTAQTFGVDLRQAPQQGQPQLPPQFQSALQEMQGMKAELEKEKALKKQQEDDVIQSQIGTFAADPKNVHFETVKAHMASLLQAGLAKDLPDAYEQAVYANPNTRSTLLAQQQTDSQEKRVAEQKARAEAARKAGSSLRGSPGVTATKNGKVTQQDLRSEIRANLRAAMDG